MVPTTARILIIQLVDLTPCILTQLSGSHGNILEHISLRSVAIFPLGPIHCCRVNCYGNRELTVFISARSCFKLLLIAAFCWNGTHVWLLRLICSQNSKATVPGSDAAALENGKHWFYPPSNSWWAFSYLADADRLQRPLQHHMLKLVLFQPLWGELIEEICFFPVKRYFTHSQALTVRRERVLWTVKPWQNTDKELLLLWQSQGEAASMRAFSVLPEVSKFIRSSDSWYHENISSHVLWSLGDWFYRWQRQNKVWGAGCWSQLIWSQSMTLLFALSQWIDNPWDWAVACRQCLWIWQSGALSRQPAANRTECWVGFKDSDTLQHLRRWSLNSCLCVQHHTHWWPHDV